MRGSLDELFTALRAEGVPVGPAEVVRTRHALACAPRLDRDGLRRFLGLLLVKRPEHQATFDWLFDLWCPDLPAADWLRAPGAAIGGTGVRADVPSRTVTGASAAQPPEQTSAADVGRRRPPWLAAVAAVLVALAALWLVWQPWSGGPVSGIQVTPPVDQVVSPADGGGQNDELPSEPASAIRFWQALVTPADVALPPRLGPAGLAGLGLLCALAAGLLARRHRRRGRLKPDPLPPVRGGPGWQPLPAARGSDTLLTPARERRAMTWRIARFTAADRTRRVDERATAAVTARAGGLARVCYRHAKYPREVWLLHDTHCQSPELAALVEELGGSLRRGGLGVRIGGFAGTPDRLWWGPGDPFTLAAEDGRRDQVLVAILTDGAGLLRALASPARRAPVARQLRNLARWPRVAVVDFSGGGALARALAPWRLRPLAPRDLTAWLGAGPETTPATAPGAGPRPLHGDLVLWAGACALVPDGCDAPAAQRLRTRLGLALDPWRIGDLRRHADGDALVWHGPARRRLVNALLRAGTHPLTGRLLPDAPAQQAIHWWIGCFEAAGKAQRDRQNPLLPWADTEPERRWDLELALLRLFLGPEAAQALLDLAASGLGTEIRQRLGELCTWDQAPPSAQEPDPHPADPAAPPAAAVLANGESDPDRRDGQLIRLPWRWQDYADRPDLLEALYRLGLGGRPLARRLHFAPPTRPALALGALAGLALAAVVTAGLRALYPPGIALVATEPLLDHPALKDQTLRLIGTGTAAGTLAVGHPKSAEVLTGVPAGATVRVTWRWGEAPSADGAAPTANNPVVPAPGSGGLLFIGGVLAEPVRPCDPAWPSRSLAVIAADPQSPDARRLAIQLLDSGSADLVLVATEWRGALARLPQRHPLLDRQTQLLVWLPSGADPAPAAADWPGPWAIVAADHGATARLFRDLGQPRTGPPAPERTGVLDLTRVPELRRLAGAGAVKLHFAPLATPDPATGLTWVRLCPGTFTQGTAPTDPPALIIVPAISPTARPLVRTADPTDRGLSVGSAVRTDALAGTMTKADPPEALALKYDDEQPAHRVSLSAFEITRTEVTNAQVRRVGQDPTPGAADDLPVATIDWQQAADLCRTLGGDLPTEAQWEFAARAGSRAPWSFGSDQARLGRYAWFNGNAGNSAHPVASKAANRFGLHDMHGNLWEWVRDWSGPYDSAASLDPTGAVDGVTRVVRGGSFVSPPDVLRSAFRFDDRPVFRSLVRGFRCVRGPVRQP